MKFRRISKKLYALRDTYEYIEVPEFYEFRVKGYPKMYITPLLEDGKFNTKWWCVTEPITGYVVMNMSENTVWGTKRHARRYLEMVTPNKFNSCLNQAIESGWISPSYKMVRERKI